MMLRILLIFCSLIIFLTGCWDQTLLVDKKMINGVSFDLTDDNQILGTVRALNIENKGGGQFELKDELLHATRSKISGLGLDINNKLPGQIDASKAHIVLIGEELSKKGINHVLEVFYRPRGAYVNSRIVLTEGKAADIISLEPETSPIAFVILKGLVNAEMNTKIPKSTVFTTWAQTVDPGVDVVLPFVKKVEKDKIAIGGVNLFNGDKFSGVSLNADQSSILLLVMNRLQKISEIVLELDKNRAVGFKSSSLKNKLNMKVDEKTNQIKCIINLNLEINIVSYSNNIKDPINIDKLNKEISVEMTKKAKEVIDLLLKANCDALGIGRKLASSHPDLWKKINWEEEYKNVKFVPKIKVNINRTGSVF